ncbi:hypothetical protein PPERSA_06361 [Pseudocohnilembus persalinus]|uniref:Uncharacterized protein n=1 Tax=Pseudocohnilembus persalinus TaxID=266149 RepID=A0A0V0QJ28_PSEPJ|nr:hypothetical protein PPERSA_06361 [Pseudocohnilembus persalinus]|eukprot:KRX02166.1 hypothetical protein PPERSA_06361 [Pseudocohnilembus persalinus]
MEQSLLFKQAIKNIANSQNYNIDKSLEAPPLLLGFQNEQLIKTSVKNICLLKSCEQSQGNAFSKNQLQLSNSQRFLFENTDQSIELSHLSLKNSITQRDVEKNNENQNQIIQQYQKQMQNLKLQQLDQISETQEELSCTSSKNLSNLNSRSRYKQSPLK